MKSQQRLLVKKPCFRKFVHLLNTGKNKVTVFVIQWWAHKVRFFSAKFFSSKVADALNLKIERKEKNCVAKKFAFWRPHLNWEGETLTASLSFNDIAWNDDIQKCW